MTSEVSPTAYSSQGLLITFEGIEGSGKSTQAKLAHEWLLASGCDCILTREPGGTALGQEVRSLLLNSSVSINPMAELLLFQADRAQHFSDVIWPALKEGKIVLCDRFTDSTVAYQGYARDLSIDLIEYLNYQMAGEGNLDPVLTIWLSIDVESALKRVRGRGQENRIDRESFGFHQAAANGYTRIYEGYRNRGRIKKIDACGDPGEVFERVKGAIAQYIDLQGTIVNA